MTRTRKGELADIEREVLKHLASSAEPQELADLAKRWWGSDINQAATALEALVELGLLKAEHLYPGQLLFHRIDPKSAEGRTRGARSLYRPTRKGREAAG